MPGRGESAGCDDWLTALLYVDWRLGSWAVVVQELPEVLRSGRSENGTSRLLLRDHIDDRDLVEGEPLVTLLGIVVDVREAPGLGPSGGPVERCRSAAS